MTETNELRQLLDERGVEWWEGEDERKTHWRSNGLTWEYFNTENGDAWLGFLGACESDISPEQAVEATLGRRTCYLISALQYGEGCKECSACSAVADEYMFDGGHCPNCGAKVIN